MANKIISQKIKNGKTIKLKINNHGIKYILSEVILEDCYFPKINGINFDLSPGDTVIDIGANIGVFAIYAASLVNKGKVYSFEPVGVNYKGLEENIRINNFKNITTEKVGVSNKSGKVRIFLEKNNTGGHSLYKEKYEDPKTIRGEDIIDVVTLKEIFDKYKIKKCNFLKIDCEGSEADILKVLPKEYFEKIEKISLEFHPNVDEIELARFLIKMGYKVTINNLDRVLGMIFAVRAKSK